MPKPLYGVVESTEVLEAAAHPAGPLRGIAARRAFKSIEKVQAAARRYLVLQKYPQLAQLHEEQPRDLSYASSLLLHTPTQIGAATSDLTASPVSNTLPTTPQALQPPPDHSVPTTYRIPSPRPHHLIPTPHYNRPEHAIVDLAAQIRATQKVNTQLLVQINVLETRLADWKVKALAAEALVKDREGVIGTDSVSLSLFEREKEAVRELREKLECSIAHEAASKGNLMQVRGKVQSRARILEANRARESKSSTSPQDAERALRATISRAQVFLEITTRTSRPQPRPTGTSLPQNHSNEHAATVQSTLIKLNRTRRSPYAPTKPPLPKLLTLHNLASSLPRPPRTRTPGLQARLSVPVTDTTFVQDRAAVNKRLAAFYAPRPSPLSEVRNSGPLAPNHSLSVKYPTIPPTPHSAPPPPPPQSQLRGEPNGEHRLPSWVDEMLDHIAHPLHHHRLASADLNRAILAKRTASTSSIDNLHLSLQVPSSSPTREDWDLISDNETLGGSKVNLLALGEAAPSDSIHPTSSMSKLRKRTPHILPHQQEGSQSSSIQSSSGSGSGWFKNVASKIGHPGAISPKPERVRGKKGSTVSRI
ncbi:uncharacterized protein EI90DRAFT_3079749 [Cantharellus anzutake]|uniref:uncharacterized protein n=1 Tax=Cantharellus anzutake TaxID=1750568 RepID=UPI0019066B8B|nr:uncharacterized protein EI90DRAFT_3079749 [Cantharellus anzutake]KAF8320973.1 hypothetical protein EI90DRAFT_3079749 [Cantharellus anzutake]